MVHRLYFLLLKYGLLQSPYSERSSKVCSDEEKKMKKMELDKYSQLEFVL